MPETAHLLDRLRELVRQEAGALRLDLERQWARPLGERVARGLALEGLVLEQVRPEGLLEFSCQTNDSRFREGDLLVIHAGDPHDPRAIRGVLEYDDETRLDVSLQGGNPFALPQAAAGWIADEGLLDLSPFYLDALDEADSTRRGRERILPLLDGSLLPSLDYARYLRAYDAAYAAGLNESQAEAAAQAYASDPVYLIQGPPGTGKTWVLAHLARTLVDEGQRVLVTALTHRAIHNALNKFARLAPDLPAAKIGSHIRARDLDLPNYETFAASAFGDLPGGYLVGATPFAARSKRLGNVEFDVVLFDEASQVTLPLALMGMLAGDRYIFIGDDRQLPPVARLRASKLARTSIFGYLGGRGYESMLDITYRMNAELTAWPSRTFYEGAIRSAPGVGERRLSLNGQAGRWDFALDPERPAVFLDLDHRNTTIRSRIEAETVCELVIELLRRGLPPEEIGVVAPFRAQGRLIRQMLRRSLPGAAIYRQIVVDTVERMQGQEREAVLVSLTTASPGFATGLAEFFFQPERLNVAITRPRTKLILVGSRRVLQAQPEEPELRSWVDLLRDLLSCCAVYSLPGGRLA